MPLDPSIILGVKPVAIPQQDPLDQFGKISSLKALLGQQDLQNLQIKHATQENEDDAAVRQAYRDAGGDSKALRSLLQSGGQYKAIQALDKFNLETEEKRTNIDKHKREILDKSVAGHRDQLAGVNDPQTAAQWVQAGYADPVLAPILSRNGTVQDALGRIPQDPAAFQNWKQQNALGATKFIEMNKPHVGTRDLGSTSEIYSTPGLGGAPTVLSSTPKTMTPGEVASNSVARANLRLHQLTADPFGLLGSGGVGGGVPGAPGATPAATPAVGGRAAPAAPGSAPAAPQGVLAGISPDTHGEEFLKALPPQVSGQVKALAEGRMSFPSGMGLRSPQVQQLLSLVSQYDPSFDAVNYQARNATRKAFTSGSESKSINALNTVMGHLDELDKVGKELNNSGIPFITEAANAVGSKALPPGMTNDLKGRLNQFNITKQAVVDEMERAYRGSGGSQAGIDAWKQTISSSDSYESLRKSIQQGVKLLNSKMEALGDQYSKGMGVTKTGLDLLNPHAQETYNRLVRDGKPEGNQKTEGKITPKAEPIVFDSLPDPKPLDGKIMTDTTTNTKYVSRGGKWVRQ